MEPNNKDLSIINDLVTKDFKQTKSGILVDPSIAKAMNDNQIYKNYIETVQKHKNVPIPNIVLLHSEILVKSVPPLMKEYEGTIMVNKIDTSPEELKRLQISTENVSDFQEVLLIGKHISDMKDQPIEPGDFVKISFKNYKALSDSHQPGLAESVYKIPIVYLEGDNRYMIIDYRDISFLQKRKFVEEKHK